jgi:hypothetical protein
MLERVIENWLTNASELSFQVPFANILASEGHTIVHITRHTPLEMGKDILTIDPDGIPCAFQLKGGNISLRNWREEISGQTEDLLYNEINHPSIPNDVTHKSYLVTNGRLEEEVSLAITQRNKQNKRRNQPILHVITGGEIIGKAINLKDNIWPTEIKLVNELLELYLKNGKGFLEKEKLSNLIFNTLPFKYKNGKKPSRASCYRAVSSSALLTSIATKSYKEANNYYAEIESWAIYLSHVLSLVERWGLSENKVKNEIEIAKISINNALKNLIDELREKSSITEGNPFVDHPFKKPRVILIMSLLALYYFLIQAEVVENETEETVDFIKSFIEENFREIEIFTEAQIPQILLIYWFKRSTSGTAKSDFILKYFVEMISTRNQPNSKISIPTTYYEVKDIIPHIIENHLNSFLPIQSNFGVEPIDDSFNGSSYTVKALLHLYTRLNWKQYTRFLWPPITKMSFEKFEPENTWEFYLWRVKNGSNYSEQPKPRKSWSELRDEAKENSGDIVPELLKKHILFSLVFLIVYPHRFHESYIRWLDTKIYEINSR